MVVHIRIGGVCLTTIEERDIRRVTVHNVLPRNVLSGNEKVGTRYSVTRETARISGIPMVAVGLNLAQHPSGEPPNSMEFDVRSEVVSCNR